MSFKITIINNEDGEVVLNEENAVAIIGAVGIEKGAHCFGYTACNGIELLSTLQGVEKAKGSILEDSPVIAMMHKLAMKAKPDED